MEPPPVDLAALEEEANRLIQSGRPGEAAELLEPVQGADRSTRLRWLAVQAHLLAGHPDRTRDLLTGPSAEPLGPAGAVLTEAILGEPVQGEPGAIPGAPALDLLANRALARLDQHRTGEAEELVEELLRLLPPGRRGRDPTRDLVTAMVFLEAGRIEEAAAAAREGGIQAQELALEHLAVEALGLELRALLRLGRFAAASSLLERLRLLIGETGSGARRIRLLELEAEWLLTLGEAEEARDCLSQADRLESLIGAGSVRRTPYLAPWCGYALGERPRDDAPGVGRILATAAGVRDADDGQEPGRSLQELARDARQRGDHSARALAEYLLAANAARRALARQERRVGTLLAELARAVRSVHGTGLEELRWKLLRWRALLLEGVDRAGEALASWETVRRLLEDRLLGLSPELQRRVLDGWGRGKALEEARARTAEADPPPSIRQADLEPESRSQATAGEERRLRILLDSAREILSAGDPVELGQTLTVQVARLIGAERVILLQPGQDGLLVETARSGERTGGWCRGAVDRALATLQPVFTTDALESSELGELASVLEMALRTVIVAPVLRPLEEPGRSSRTDPGSGRVLGYLYADDRVSLSRLEPGDLEVVEALARFAGISWRNLLLRRETEEETELLRSASTPRFPELVGESSAMQEVARVLERAAPSDLAVLLVGETGTGKDLMTRLIHQNSTRSEGPMVYLSCAALPEGLLEAELFGIEKGVATGVDDRPGLLEQADGGTLYLDGVEGVDPGIQAKMLRFLQEQTFERVGGKGPVQVEVRVVSSAGPELDQAVREGRFREDLYYRLNGIRIDLPPLRDRPEDIPALAEVLLERIAAEAGREVPDLTAGTLSALRRHRWPGNVRELANVLRKALLLGLRDGRIQEADLEIAPEPLPPPRTLMEALTELERDAVTEALGRTRGGVTAAGRELGISRMALQRLLERLDLDRRSFKEERS